jgi:7-keto-8-aminopelargonate synthetase-like enzyme
MLQCGQVSDLLLQEYGQYVQAINYPTLPVRQENAYSFPSTCKHVPSDSAFTVYTQCE